MKYETLGSTGTAVSPLCFGTWHFGAERKGVDRERAHALLDEAHERGINFIDTANVYGDPGGLSEEIIGEWLTDHDREQFVIASKVVGPMGDGPNESGLSRKHVRAQIEGTLDRLGTDYLDLYYIHWWDEETPIEETLSTFDDLVSEGRVRHVGASNVAAWQLTKSLWQSDVHDWPRFEVLQPYYNAAARERASDLLDVCADQEIAVCPYSPLEKGFLTGKYARDGDAPAGSRGDVDGWDSDRWTSRQWEVLEAVQGVADELEATPAQVAIRWLMERDRVQTVPIIAARTHDQLEENLGALDVSLSSDQFERVATAGRGEKEST